MKVLFFLFCFISFSSFCEEHISFKSIEYTASKSSSLKQSLTQWASRNDFTLDWTVFNDSGDEIDWIIKEDINVKGSFYFVVADLLKSYEVHGLDFKWNFYKNRVLKVRLINND